MVSRGFQSTALNTLVGMTGGRQLREGVEPPPLTLPPQIQPCWYC